MAIAGSAAPSYVARIVDGQLVTERQTLRQGVIADVDIALQRLLAGEEIFLSARSDVMNAVRRTLEMALRNGNADG